jgi:hypothetical protein
VKLPYRAGDLFALPLGDGRSVEAQIVACAYHTVDIAAGDTVLRVSDRALVLQRWRAHGRDAIARNGAPRGERWVGPAHAERIVATALGVADLRLPPLEVRRPSLPFARHPHRIRIAGHGERVDARTIPANARIVEFTGVIVDRIEALAALPDLRALRFARMPSFDIATLDGIGAETLAFESIRDLRGVGALRARRGLAQLELLDVWPLELDAVMPLLEAPELARCEVDLGGRRKNVELYRRATWAYPWPFDLLERLDAAQ